MLKRVHSRCFCSVTAKPWLFVGLGNPGEKYKGTRHNVGFQMIDAFAESQQILINRIHCKAIFGQGFVGDTPVLLAKPQTYMNLSGESVGPLAAYYKLPLSRVVVIHDDMTLPCGVLQFNQKEATEATTGIGRPPGQMDPKAFLLQMFNATAQEKINSALPEGVVTGLKSILSEGLAETAVIFNKEQKYKHLKSLNILT